MLLCEAEKVRCFFELFFYHVLQGDVVIAFCLAEGRVVDGKIEVRVQVRYVLIEIMRFLIAIRLI